MVKNKRQLRINDENEKSEISDDAGQYIVCSKMKGEVNEKEKRVKEKKDRKGDKRIDKNVKRSVIVEHRHSKPSDIDPSTLPGPVYPSLPDKSDHTPGKVKRIGNKLIAKALMEHGGKISKSAKALHLSHYSLKQHIYKTPELKRLMAVSREAELEFVEDKFMDQVKLNNLGALIFYLKCHGKDHGWIERIQEKSENKKPTVTFKYTLVMPQNKAERKVVDMGTIEAEMSDN